MMGTAQRTCQPTYFKLSAITLVLTPSRLSLSMLVRSIQREKTITSIGLDAVATCPPRHTRHSSSLETANHDAVDVRMQPRIDEGVHAGLL